MTLVDLMDLNQIPELMAAGLVKSERHGSAPLTIYNYTQACQYSGAWCETTRACRGLIVDDDGAIIARPFPKFHNAGEHEETEIGFSAPFTITEKIDGSMGVLYDASDGWEIATRGSFTSSQARRATKMLRLRYAGFEPIPGLTYLYEILYPENRIVVDYGKREDLILLAVLDTATGRDVIGRSHFGWPGPVARSYDVSCSVSEVLEALNLTNDGNSEGVVLRFDYPASGPHFRVKVKLSEYVRLHRLLFGCSTKTIWEALSVGQSLAELAERVPDEFHAWLQATVSDLNTRYRDSDVQARSEFSRLKSRLGEGVDRKTFAMEAVKSPNRALLFSLLDEKEIAPLIWKTLKPEHARPFKTQTEDVA